MARKTVAQRKAAIKVWTAKYDGTCPECQSGISAGRSLVCRFDNHVIHYACHPDWRPSGT